MRESDALFLYGGPSVPRTPLPFEAKVSALSAGSLVVPAPEQVLRGFLFETQSMKRRLTRSDGTLIDRAEAFAVAYVGPARFNATAAARIAGYKDPAQSGWELKKNLDVRARIDELLAESTLTAKEVLRELTEMALAPTSHYQQITQVDEDTGEVLSVRQDYSAKTKALELLGKHHRLFVDKQEVELRDLSAAETLDKKLLYEVDEGASQGLDNEPDAGGTG